MTESLKKKSVLGIMWSGTERVANDAIHFITGIILARLLTPSDYGTVGLLTVFITFSNIFIDGGLTKALIQKKDRTREDFHTVFLFNLAMSIFLYIVIFFCAPLVSRLYDIEELTSLLRVLALVLIITPFSSIPITQLTINVDFRSISLASIPSSIISGVIGIYLAYSGWGAYALVIQQVSSVVVRGILVNLISKYKIRLFFSKQSFVNLFSFSYKLVLSSSLDKIYTTAYTMILGKSLGTESLGLYSRGTHFVTTASGILSDIFNRVTFPVLSTVQDEAERLRQVFRKYIQGSSFFIFPVLLCMIVVSKPLILLLLTDKWIEAVPIMQLMAFAYLTDHLCTINRNILYTKKRSDLALKLEVIKKSIALAIFLVSLKFGLIGVCVGQILYAIVAVILNSFYTRQLIGISLWQQALDYLPLLGIALVSAVIPYFFVLPLIESNVLQIIIGGIIYILIYLLINAMVRTYPYLEVKTMALNAIKGKRNKHK